MRWYIVLVGLLHAAFMVCEMYRWEKPILLKNVMQTKQVEFTPPQQDLVADIVHNAGIYNAVLALGLFWAAYRGKPAHEVALVLFAGAALAGAFGTVTLESPVTAVQAGLGVIGVILTMRARRPETA